MSGGPRRIEKLNKKKAKPKTEFEGLHKQEFETDPKSPNKKLRINAGYRPNRQTT
jgi:hypothetical protein